MDKHARMIAKWRRLVRSEPRPCASPAAVRRVAAMPLYYDRLYTAAIDPASTFPRERYDLVRDGLVQQHGAVVDIRSVPSPVSRADLVLAHDEDYVDRFLSGTLGAKEVSRIGLKPWTPLIIDRTLTLVGGSLAAMGDACGLAAGGVAGNMAGGTHHAGFAQGAGYCIFNDLAVCARVALRQGLARRVAVIDLDVHQGDGTAEIFAGEDSVFTASVHCAANFPLRKETSDLDLPLPRGAGDEAYLEACEEAVRAALAVRPDLVFFQAGVDALREDGLGHLAVTREGMRRRNALVFQATRGLPLVLFMGGGYSKPISHTVAAFVDLFAAAGEEHAARLAGVPGREGAGSGQE
mmetsp:Transcript_58447/g.165077  ORF Transcript_58447/g.165077 Transcript_58447/m.165077 type:complete len:351 (-) Transcript_58447:94-1146(-)